MMPVAVRQVYQDSRLGHESNEKPALCLRGDKYAHCIVIGFPVRVLKRPAKDFDTLRPTSHHGGEYPVALMVKHLLKAGRKNGITLHAARLIEMIRTDGHYPGGKPFNEDDQTIEDDKMAESTLETEGTVPLDVEGLVKPEEKAEVKKTVKKTAKKKTPPKAKAVKAVKEAKRQVKNPSDGLGRENTAGRVICERLLAGDSNEQAVKVARKKFPDNKIADNYGAWYRNKLIKDGKLKAAK